MEVGWEGDAGEFALEVGGVAGAVLGVVEDGVGGVEDVPLRDLAVGVVSTEFGESPVCDVLAAVGAVFVVDVERKALRVADEVQIRYDITCQNGHPRSWGGIPRDK